MSTRACFFVIAALLATCWPVEAQEGGRDYSAEIARLQIQDNYSSSFWLDNDTVMFVAVNRDELSKQEGYSYRPELTHIYSMRWGHEPARYPAEKWPQRRTINDTYYFCASDGRVAFSTGPVRRSDDAAWWSALIRGGPVSQERSSSLIYHVEGSAWSNRNYVGPVGKRCNQLMLPTLEGHLWTISYDGKKALDFGPLKQTDNFGKVNVARRKIQIVDARTFEKTPVQGIPSTEVSGACVHALSWENAFVTSNCYAIRSARATSATIWKIFVDGRVEKSVIRTDGLRNLIITPYRDGYFATAIYEFGTTKEKEEKSGVFLISSGHLKRILSGYYKALAVSPNGCGVFFSQWTNFRSGQPLSEPRLKNLCER